MEPLVTVLIAIVVFAFQVYSNFKKEQEKARQRKMAPPPLPEENAQRRVEVPKSKAVIPQPALPREFERYSGMMDTDEVKRERKARERKQTLQRLQVEEEIDAPLLNEETGFDLRDAVIKSTILERPYQ